MKNHAKLFGIIAFATIIGFLTTACPTDDDGGGGGAPAFLGNKLELSGQVYLESWNDTNTSVTYSNFGGNLTINDYNGGSGEVRSGRLNYTIETPRNLHHIDFDDFIWGYDNFQVSPENVNGVTLYSLSVNSDDYWGLSYENQRMSIRNNSFSGTYEYVIYVYVENDVTVSGTGKRVTETEDQSTFTTITRNLNLAFKAGWNAVHGKSEFSGTFTGSMDDPTSYNQTNTETIVLGNPSLRWVLGESDYDDYSQQLLDMRSLSTAPEKGKPGLKIFDRIRRNSLQ